MRSFTRYLLAQPYVATFLFSKGILYNSLFPAEVVTGTLDLIIWAPGLPEETHSFPPPLKLGVVM